MLAGTAFLIAIPFATGVAKATVASDDVPATNTIVATSFVKLLAILLSPGGVALRRTILWPDGGSMRDPLRTGCIEAANFVRTVEPARRPPEAKRRNAVSVSTRCKAWAAGLTGCAIDARPRQTKQ
jgi:hypothetical protein